MRQNETVVFSLDQKFEKLEKEIKISALKVLNFLKKNGIFLEIYLLGDNKMRAINKKTRGKDKPTNILSFCEPHRFPRPEISLKKANFKPIGEIYLNPDYIKGDGSKEELLLLLIHGILHLLGYVHKKKNDRIKMEKAERKLLRQIQTIKMKNSRIT